MWTEQGVGVAERGTFAFVANSVQYLRLLKHFQAWLRTAIAQIKAFLRSNSHLWHGSNDLEGCQSAGELTRASLSLTTLSASDKVA